MLIELQVAAFESKSHDFPAPVVGAIGTSIPTSADIHMYADPETQWTQFPRLYVACEGLQGGENVPMANQAMMEAKKKVDGGSESHYHRKMRDNAQGARIRKLGFAKDDVQRTREYTVQELYPRLLYTFSHVVVFVLYNER